MRHMWWIPLVVLGSSCSMGDSSDDAADTTADTVDSEEQGCDAICQTEFIVTYYNADFDLDGDFKFNTARLINHSCNPNCEVTGTGLKVWVHAIKDIKKNEEFSYDYGFSFDDDYKNYPCRCRSKNCCGYIIREGSRWRIKKKKKQK